MAKYTGTYPSVYKTIDYQKKLADEANRLAYTGRPKEAKYPNGHPTKAWKTAQNKVAKGFKYWSKASRGGFSCDVGSGVTIRSVYDRNMPLGLWKQLNYMNAHPEAYQKVSPSNAKAGDIGHYTKKGIVRKGHIFIVGEGDKIKEASAGNWAFSTTNAHKARFDMSNKKRLTIYRPVNKQVYSPLKKGSKGTQVKNLQKYLNWYFKDDKDLKALKVDGDFGSITTGRVKLFQRQQKLEIDGVVGKQTVAKMKGVTK